MKKMIAIIMAVIMIMAMTAVALADTVSFTGFYLDNGIYGKQQTPFVVKTTPTNNSSRTVITSISGATSEEPMVARVRKNDGSEASSTIDISSTGTYMKTWKSGYGINGESYYLMMQNTTYGPPVTVSGTFTP